MRAAAKAADVDRTTAYAHRNSDPKFAAAWDVALEDACDDLEGEARRRGFKGTSKPVYQNGKLVGTVQEYSDVLLMFLLKANRPERFRDNHHVKTEVSGPNGGAIPLATETTIKMVYGESE